MKTHRHHGVGPLCDFVLWVAAATAQLDVFAHATTRIKVYNTVMILRFSVVVYEKIRKEKNTTPNRRARAERANMGTR